jgi:two-component system nitrogen regulation response regulator GlnG
MSVDRILVVDDVPSILFAMKMYLMAEGYDVSCAQYLEEAKSLLEKNDFSAVISDLRLTGTDNQEGLELIDFVRDHRLSTKIIILTAYGFPETEREAIERGADAFLRKPKPLPDLAAVVSKLLQDRSPRQTEHEPALC